MQHNVSQFLNDMCDKISYQQINVIRCPGCNVQYQYEKTNRTLKLLLPNNSKTYTLQELIDYNIGEFKDTSNVCNSYSMRLTEKIDITIYNKIVVIELQLFSEDDSSTRIINSLKIKAIPQTKVTSGTKKSNVVGCILHEGNSIQNGNYLQCYVKIGSGLKYITLPSKRKRG